MDDIRTALETHHPQAFAWAMTCCRNDRRMAEDVLQSSYLKVLEGRARFDGRAAFQTWLFSVIRNTARDSWRSPWRRRETLPLDGELADRAECQQIAVEMATLDQALARLPARQSQIVALVYGHGLSVSEAADVIGVSRGSAATHLHRAKQALRRQLGTETKHE